MRRRLFTIILLFILPIIAHAQYTTVVTGSISECFSAFQNISLVRDWPGHDYAVTYALNPAGGRAFCAMNYSDYLSGAASPSFPAYIVPLPAPLTSVTDFRIIGDYVCFCGTGVTYTPTYTVNYCLGFFKMTDFISGGTVNFKLIKIKDCDLLETIEGFKDSYGFKVYAIGQHTKTVGSSVYEYYAIYEVDDPPTATGYSCKYTTIPLQHSGNEFFEDIVVLDDRVVFVCSHHFNVTGSPYMGPIVMRWINKSVGLSDPQIDTRYYQTSSAPFPEREINSRIKAKPINGETFVIGYTNSDHTTGSSTRRIRVFDLNFENNVSQEFPIYSKLAMYEMAYNKNNDILTILEPDGVTSRFVFTHPLNTYPYPALTLNDPSLSHVSLDTISSKQFISTKVKNWTLQCADQISYNPSTTSNSCIDDGNVEVVVIPRLNRESYYAQLDTNSDFNPITTSETVVSCIVKVLCVSQ